MAGNEEECSHKGGDMSSDDDIEIVPESVDNYWLEYGDETPVSFATLPYFKLGEEASAENVVYIRGTQDNGMRLYMKAVAWKVELTKDIKPVFHLKTDKYWIQLKKPRKSYEETIRSIISVALFLNYALINPNDSERVAWSYVKETYQLWEVAPSRNDLLSHIPVVRHLAALDEDLASSSALQTIDAGIPKKRLASAIEDGQQESKKGMDSADATQVDLELPEEKKGRFEDDDLDIGEDMDGFGDMEEMDELTETVCCICDNGGDVVCCDGPCMRSFHGSRHAGGASDSHCSTLGYREGEAERMDKFYCPNCRFNIHQCYLCGKLGSSTGAAQEVFACDAAMCGHFYHPACVADLLLKDKVGEEKEAMVLSIKEGKGFTCPMHKCFKCGLGEDKKEESLQFGVCRRCPRVWHRKCLPPELVPKKEEEPEDDEEEDEDLESSVEDEKPRRAWDNLLPNRVLLYCKRHTIIPTLGTPARNHVKFPEGSLPTAKRTLVKSHDMEERKKSKLMKSAAMKKKDEAGLKVPSVERAAKLLELAAGRKKKPTLSVGQGKLERHASAKGKLGMATQRSLTKVGGQPSPVIVVKGRSDLVSSSKKDWSMQEDEQKTNKPFLSSKGLVAKLERSNSQASRPSTPKALALQADKPPPAFKAIMIDSKTKSMVDEIVQRAKASVTLESVLSKQDIPTIYRRHAKTTDKKYSLFKIESVIRGMRKALETLNQGGSLDDAKANCSPEFIKFIDVCKNDLKVYLSPFLHGARYTSYGRHFTKPGKLDEIVDRIHWYAEKGDMIVDFCCGSNDFSLKMKKKLEEMGKTCEYKNFDLIQTNNDFNFEKRDWFHVKQNELPDGNRLIMGLNPPFGLKGSLANQFIDHALKFRPKLLVLIVPKETERLDRKRDPYDLVWEDTDLLVGQSFYLPGSVDVDNNYLNDWNIVAPPVYVWSRPDWTSKHKQVALDQGQISFSTGTYFVSTSWKTAPSLPALPSKKVEQVERREGEDVMDVVKTEKHMLHLESLGRDECTGGLETDCGQDSTSVAKGNDQIKRREGSEHRLEDLPTASSAIQKKENLAKSSITTNTTTYMKKDDNEGSILTKTTTTLKNIDTSLLWKRHEKSEERQVESSSTKARVPDSPPSLHDSQPSLHNSKALVKKEMPKGKPVEEQFHTRAKKAEISRQTPQESPSKVRRSSEMKHDGSTELKHNASSKERKPNQRHDSSIEMKHSKSSKERKANERYDRADDTRFDDHQWRRTSGNHRSGTEVDSGGRRSPNRWDRYESDRRKSPDRPGASRYGEDRYGMSRQRDDRRGSPGGSRRGEDRRGSPGINRHVEDRRGSPGMSRHGENRKGSPDRSRPSGEHRRASPEKPHYSSVVDLDMLFSSSGPRDYDEVHRGSTEKDQRPGSPNRRHMPDETTRSWVNSDNYQVASRANDYINAGYVTSGLPKVLPNYDDALHYGRDYQGQDTLNALRPDPYQGLDARMAGRYNDTAFVGQSGRVDLYQPEPPRGMLGMEDINYPGDRYGVGLYRAGIAGGVPPPVHPSVYASLQPQQQLPPLGLSNPSMISSQSLFDNRLLHPQTHRAQYPPSQGRLPGQQFPQGGWFDD